MAASVIPCPSCGAKNRVPAVASGHPRCAKCQTDLPWIADATDADFDAVADSTKIPVVVDLWAPWCGPCRQLTPRLEQLATEGAGEFKLVKVNVDHNPRTQARFGVQAIPTLVLLKDGATIGTQRGAPPMDALRRFIGQAR